MRTQAHDAQAGCRKRNPAPARGAGAGEGQARVPGEAQA